MSWLRVIIMAALVFAVAAFGLRLPRNGYTLVAATLLFGLAGYALQGSPGAPSAPGATGADSSGTGELLVEARREFYDPARLPSRFVITSDAFSRRGDYQRAAAFARQAVKENPSDGEAWTALGNALSEHADGRLTPAALYAFGQAEARAPGAPAPGYFLGLAMLRSGEPERARAIWADVLAAGPPDAAWRPVMAERLARLDALMAQR